MSPTMPTELVCNALKLAIYQRQPKPGLCILIEAINRRVKHIKHY